MTRYRGTSRERADPALTVDGFDEALIGYAEGWIPAEGGSAFLDFDTSMSY